MESAPESNILQGFPQHSGHETASTDEIPTSDENPFDWMLNDNTIFDWEDANLQLYGPSGPSYERWPQDPAAGLPEAPQMPEYTLQDNFTAPLPEVATGISPSVNQPFELLNPVPMRQGLTDVTQFLDGAYCPPNPCSYCRKHRLQCLIIRTTSANPNPVSSCSSCVALFRECSLALGEKRQASRFETLSPVLGHLHGLRELSEDVSGGQVGQENELDASVLEGAEGKREPKESKQFVRKGARALRAWYLQNQEYPYPSEEQKAQLAHETGFSRKRISTWFANARRRQKQKLEFSGRPQIHRAGSPMPTSQWTAMTPLERWQASPPEDDPVPESAIKDAIAAEPNWGNIPSLTHSSSSDPWLNFDEFSSSLFDSSISGLGSRRSETSSESISTTWSHHSATDSALPIPIKPPKRRHRRSTTTEEHKYQCTFCPQTFKKKNDWTRHETSVHISLDSWICTPNLPDLAPTEPNQPSCGFCSLESPPPSHWEEHDFRVCAEKPPNQRSFTRKDHLWQHLRKFHACTKSPIPDLDVWRSSKGDIQSRCGFCGEQLSSWSARSDHLATHFKEGARMDRWEGDWGFDEEINGMLKNAVLPGRRESGA
ncbi:hypothetical protein BDV25DRAFT_165645, partial [Aspergillus avenaceus]